MGLVPSYVILVTAVVQLFFGMWLGWLLAHAQLPTKIRKDILTWRSDRKDAKNQAYIGVGEIGSREGDRKVDENRERRERAAAWYR